MKKIRIHSRFPETGEIPPDTNPDWQNFGGGLYDSYYANLSTGEIWKRYGRESSAIGSFKILADPEGKMGKGETPANIAEVLSIARNGNYLIVSQERCQLCNGEWASSSFRNGDCCPHCGKRMGVIYEKIGHASVTGNYLVQSGGSCLMVLFALLFTVIIGFVSVYLVGSSLFCVVTGVNPC